MHTVYALIFAIYLCEGHLTVVPQNTVAIIGTNLTLHCDTNTTTKLSWYFGHRNDNDKIFNGFVIDPAFPRHRRQLPFDLVISDVRPSDAGLYSCLHSKSHQATAEVIVVESCPVCHMTSSRSDVMRVSCDVRFSGNWSPSLQISRIGIPTVRVTLFLDPAQDSFEHLNYTRTLGYHASVSVSPMSATAVYATELVFDEERRPSASTATNIPTTNCTWQSPGISSADSAAEPNASVKATFQHGSVLVCSAEGQGHQQSSYSWLDTVSGRVVSNSSQLDVCDLSSTTTASDLRCVVTDSVNQFNVTGNVSADSTLWTIIRNNCNKSSHLFTNATVLGVVFGGSLVTLLLINAALVVMWTLRHRTGKEKTMSEARSHPQEDMQQQQQQQQQQPPQPQQDANNDTPPSQAAEPNEQYQQMRMSNRELPSPPSVYTAMDP